MTTLYNEVHVSLFELLIPIGIIAVIFFLLFHNRHKAKQQQNLTPSKSWAVPTVDRYANGSSVFHSWDPRLKITTLLVYIFVVGFLNSLSASFVAFFISLISLKVSGMPWQRSLARLKAMAGFLLMFIVILPFTVKGKAPETLILLNGFDDLAFHSSGFWLACSIVLKATSIALLMEPLFSSSPFPVTLLALSRLGLPIVICQMILLSHRYIYVFTHEMKRMYRSMKIRGFKRRTSLETMRTLGNYLGMLVVRSFDRTQNVYEAMLSRGYTGVFPTYTQFDARRSDWHKVIFWLFLGCLLLTIDLYL